MLRVLDQGILFSVMKALMRLINSFHEGNAKMLFGRAKN